MGRDDVVTTVGRAYGVAVGGGRGPLVIAPEQLLGILAALVLAGNRVAGSKQAARDVLSDVPRPD